MVKTKLMMKDASKRLAVAVLSILLILLGLSATGIFDVASYVVPVAKIGAAIILFVEIGLISMFRKGIVGIDFLTGFELLIGLFIVVEAGLSFMGIGFGPLSALSGWVLLLFGIVFFFEAWFR